MNANPKSPRVAVIGSGYWGRNLVRVFDELGVLDLVCDSSDEAIADMRTRHPGVRACHHTDDVLGDPTIDAVVIASPAITHADLASRAMRAGKDVFVEKPLALSEEDGEALCALARETGRVLMVGHILWYHPAVLRLRALIDDGTLGRVHYVYSHRLNMGKLRREENVLWSFAPHDVSVMLGLTGESPASVKANGGSFLHHHIADTTVTLFDFPGGIQGHIFVSWLHPFKEQKLVVVGSECMAVFDDMEPWESKLTLYRHGIKWSGQMPIARKADGIPEPIDAGEPLLAEGQHFIDCVINRSKPRTDGEEGLRVLKVLNACEAALGADATSAPVAAPEVEYQCHASSVIDERVTIGPGTRIWHFSHVLSGSVIGRECNIGQNVVIGPDVRIGDRCKIQNNVSVYSGVTLEDDVFCGPSMVFTNVNTPRAHVNRRADYARTLVRKGATIGANATIVCGHTLGEYSFVGAGAVIVRDVAAHAVMVGNPARRIGWACRCGERLNESLVCPACGSRYTETTDGITMAAGHDAHVAVA